MTSTLNRHYGGVQFDDGRIVPYSRVIGVAELAALFTARLGDMSIAIPKRGRVTSAQVSTWASRHRTSGLPLPLPIQVSRGLLWDRNDFVDPLTGRLLWTGPPGRYGLPDAEG
jgi:hypothetical protein